MAHFFLSISTFSSFYSLKNVYTMRDIPVVALEIVALVQGVSSPRLILVTSGAVAYSYNLNLSNSWDVS